MNKPARTSRILSRGSRSPKKPVERSAPTPHRSASRPLSIDLALQGGGSHGAFTWGVLDRLLEDPTIEPNGVSGTSAGALNAAVMATGWAEGGRRGAQAALRAFWLDVATDSHCFGAGPAPWAAPWLGQAPVASLVPPVPPVLPGLGMYNLEHNPFFAWSQAFLRLFSPYQFNPSGTNPLLEILQRHVKPQVLENGPLALFVTATSVRTGQPRVFTHEDLSLDALLASACLPQLFRAVEIEGEPYWDGGYSGNPALWPLIYNTPSMDVVLVKINQLSRPRLPCTPSEISDRVNEITFNAGLVAEMRAIAFVQKLVAQGRVDPGTYKDLRLHMVADDVGLAPLEPSSKLNTERAFLEALHSLGHAAADRWLMGDGQGLGQRSTLDIRATFLNERQAAGG